MLKLPLIFFILLLLTCATALAQKVDSTIESLQKIPPKYISGINKKIEKYSKDITSKTIKTLTRLSHWEEKIHSLLLKANPQTAERLFGSGQLTFTSMLQKLKAGEGKVLQYQASYSKYNDDVNTSLKYLAQQKQMLDTGFIKKIKSVSTKMQQLDTTEDRTEAIGEFIRERKKQLATQVFQQIGKSRYLTKINKEGLTIKLWGLRKKFV